MANHPVKKNKMSAKTVILSSLLVMVALVILWHILVPILGITIDITATIWGIAVITVVLICISTLLFFLFTGLGILILSLFVFFWTLIAIILFPLLFPLLIPTLIIMITIAVIVRNKKTP